MSRGIVVLAPDYLNGGPLAFRNRYGSVVSEINHTSKTQAQGTINMLEDICSAYRASPLQKSNEPPLTVEMLFGWLKGFNSDHAGDQKKLYEILWKHKIDFERILRGQKLAERSASDSEVAELLSQHLSEYIEATGGHKRWDSLEMVEQTKEKASVLRNIYLELGNDDFNTLSDDAKRITDLFVWSGCCMHKELNMVKAGSLGMRKYWKQFPDARPVSLPNRDKSAALSLGKSFYFILHILIFLAINFSRRIEQQCCFQEDF